MTVSGDHDISRPAGSIAPDEPRHSDTSNANGRESEQNPPESSANDVSTSPKIKSIVTTIAGQVITAAPTAITIPGIIIKQGGPGVTLRGTSVALDTAGQLVVDSKTIPIPPGTNTEPFTTTIGGQVIAATSDAFAIAGTTLVPGHAGVSVNGTLLSLDTAGHFVVGSKTRTFDSESMSLSAVTAGTPGPGGKSTPLVATPAGNVANQIAKGNGTVTGVQPFEGKAKDAFYCLKTKKGIVVFMAMILAVSM